MPIQKKAGDLNFAVRDNTRTRFVPERGFVSDIQHKNRPGELDITDNPMGWAPVVGDILQGGQALIDFGNKQYGRAALNAGLLLIPNVIEKPIKQMVKGVSRGLRYAPNGTINLFDAMRRPYAGTNFIRHELPIDEFADDIISGEYRALAPSMSINRIGDFNLDKLPYDVRNNPFFYSSDTFIGNKNMLKDAKIYPGDSNTPQVFDALNGEFRTVKPEEYEDITKKILDLQGKEFGSYGNQFNDLPEISVDDLSVMDLPKNQSYFEAKMQRSVPLNEFRYGVFADPGSSYIINPKAREKALQKLYDDGVIFKTFMDKEDRIRKILQMTNEYPDDILFKYGGLIDRLKAHYGDNDKIREAIVKARGGRLYEEGGYAPSDSIKNYIKQQEAFRSKWYKDGNGIDTVGYGFTGKNVAKLYPNGMTRKQADEYFDNLVDRFAKRMVQLTPNIDRLTQNQKDALFSYFYNIGEGNYTKGSPKMQQALRDFDLETVMQNIDAGYNDKKNPGLRKRRDYERELFGRDIKQPLQPVVIPEESPALFAPEIQRFNTQIPLRNENQETVRPFMYNPIGIQPLQRVSMNTEYSYPAVEEQPHAPSSNALLANEIKSSLMDILDQPMLFNSFIPTSVQSLLKDYRSGGNLFWPGGYLWDPTNGVIPKTPETLDPAIVVSSPETERGQYVLAKKRLKEAKKEHKDIKRDIKNYVKENGIFETDEEIQPFVDRVNDSASIIGSRKDMKRTRDAYYSVLDNPNGLFPQLYRYWSRHHGYKSKQNADDFYFGNGADIIDLGRGVQRLTPDSKQSTALFNEFVENRFPSVLPAGTYKDSPDRIIGDMARFPARNVSIFGGIEDGKFRLDSLKNFSDETTVIPARNIKADTPMISSIQIGADNELNGEKVWRDWDKIDELWTLRGNSLVDEKNLLKKYWNDPSVQEGIVDEIDRINGAIDYQKNLLENKSATSRKQRHYLRLSIRQKNRDIKDYVGILNGKFPKESALNLNGWHTQALARMSSVEKRLPRPMTEIQTSQYFQDAEPAAYTFTDTNGGKHYISDYNASVLDGKTVIGNPNGSIFIGKIQDISRPQLDSLNAYLKDNPSWIMRTDLGSFDQYRLDNPSLETYLKQYFEHPKANDPNVYAVGTTEPNKLWNTKASGGKIHIKPENRGKFTALKKRTGHSASWFKAHGTPAQKKMAVFALNSKKWKHGDGGIIDRYGADAVRAALQKLK